jgi:outer membrane protein assembly factor BamD (BamD/ComL family)
MQDDSPRPGRSNYLDFELEIGEGRGREYPVAVLRSPAGEARATMRFPFDELALDLHLGRLQIALLRSGGTHRRVPSEEERAVQDFGQALFDALLGGEIRSCYDVSLREAAQQDKGLRLKLRIHSPELNTLPWEFLYDSRQAEYVCLSRQTPIVRYLESPRFIHPLTVAPPLRILGMVASPIDLPALDVEREKERMERAIHDLRAQGLVELTWLPGQTWRDLEEATWGGPWHIFHFVGHGGFDAHADEGFIALADRKGRTNCLSATRLGRLLADHTALRLVLLNSCEGAKGSDRDIFSSTASILVRRGIPAALAMQYEITDRAAIEFARAFYQALAYGMAVDEAMVVARKAISLAVTNTVEWGTPVLYMRTPDGVLFEVAETQRARRRAPPVSEAPPEISEELAKHLEHLYVDGLGAFWLEQWATAIRCFQAVVDERPDYRDGDAAGKLEEARRRGKLEALYAQAQTAHEVGDWSAMLSALEKLVAEAPAFRDAAALLEMAKRQKGLADLYTQAQQLQQAGQWQAVVNVFAQIDALDPDYPDPDNLLSAAEREIVEQERQAELEELYSRALLQLDAGRWLQARELLVQLREMQAGFREVEQLLARVEAEIEQERAERQRQERLAALYEQAIGQAEAGQWQQVQVKMHEIHAIAPQFDDPQGLALRAQEEMAHQQRLNDLYAQAQAARESGDWSRAVSALEKLEAEAPDFPGVAVQVEELKKQGYLASLYGRAQQYYDASEWQAVIDTFALIAATEPDYPDPNGLLPLARQEAAAQLRLATLEDLYDRAIGEVDAEHWGEAQHLLAQVQEREPGFREAESLSARITAGIAREEAEYQRQAQLEDLYQKAADQIQARDWPEAKQHLQELRCMDPNYRDVAALMARVESERERENRLATLYAQAEEASVRREWARVTEWCEQMLALEPGYRDVEAMLARAQRKHQLAKQFARALEHLQAQHWQEAIEVFRVIVELDPEYGEPAHGSAASLLARSRQERERSELSPPPAPRSRRPVTFPEEIQLSGERGDQAARCETSNGE